MLPIVFVKVPRNSNIDPGEICAKGEYEEKFYSPDDENYYFYLGNTKPSFPTIWWLNVGNSRWHFIFENYTVYPLLNSNNLKLSYIELPFWHHAKFYLKKKALSNYFLIDPTQNNYQIEPLDKNNNLVQVYKSFYKKYCFLALGIILAALFVSICVASFGFALIATKVAIAITVLSSIFSIASFSMSFLSHRKIKKAQESSNFEHNDNFYQNIDDSNNLTDNIQEPDINISSNTNNLSAYTPYMQQNQNNTPDMEVNPYNLPPDTSLFHVF